MTQDWRKIEAAIADFLEREGLMINNFADTIAETPEGCGDFDFEENGEGFAINVTKLARELADLK